MVFNELTPAQEKIIKEICYTQLSSLRRIYNDEQYCDTDVELLLIKNEVSKEEFKQRLEISMARFKQYGREPEAISKMEPIEVERFKQILYGIERKYQKNYPKAIDNLWSRVFILDNMKAVCTN